MKEAFTEYFLAIDPHLCSWRFLHVALVHPPSLPKAPVTASASLLVPEICLLTCVWMRVRTLSMHGETFHVKSSKMSLQRLSPHPPSPRILTSCPLLGRSHTENKLSLFPFKNNNKREFPGGPVFETTRFH